MKLHPTRVPNRRLARRVAVAGHPQPAAVRTVIHPAAVPVCRFGPGGDFTREYTPKVKGR